jgi:hypothetical protein
MERTDIMLAARSALTAEAARTADLLRSRTELAVPLGGGSRWTAREAAVHLAVSADLYAEISTGVPSPIAYLGVEDAAVYNDHVIADVAETDPDKLARLMLDSVARFLQVTEGRPGDQMTPWHAGHDLDIAALTAILVGEQLLHGLDIATALELPWPIDPAHALLALDAYALILGVLLNPVTTRGHCAAYGIEVRGGPRLTVRFTDGVYSIEPAGGPVDCVIAADPVAFALTVAGRMSRWEAIALGLITPGGTHPELTVGFFELFICL